MLSISGGWHVIKLKVCGQTNKAPLLYCLV